MINASEWLPYAAASALIAGLVTTTAVPLVVRLAMSMRAVDYPGGRRTHERAVPRLGGVAIVTGLFFGVVSVILVRWPVYGDSIANSQFVVWLLAGSLVFLVGLVEDVMSLSRAKRLLAEVAAAWMVVSAGWKFEVFALPVVGDVELGWLGSVLTIIWIVGVANAINLIDGLDGLAAGVIAIIAASMLVLSGVKGDFLTVVVYAGMMGACLGFLRFNWAPARVFMGDAGSLTLGFLLATLTVKGALKSPAAVAILVPILALGVPVIDTLMVMLVRFLERPKLRLVGRVAAIFKADRNHIHHLVQHLRPHRPHREAAVRWIYGLVLVSCGAALAVALTKSGRLGVSLVIVEVIVIFVVRRLGFARRVRALGAERRHELLQDVSASVEEGHLRVS
jgi:UDP-GlcNAc:undecaprenyl-phosphate GlcNAc-1-phosphate transferase